MRSWEELTEEEQKEYKFATDMDKYYEKLVTRLEALHFSCGLIIFLIAFETISGEGYMNVVVGVLFGGWIIGFVAANSYRDSRSIYGLQIHLLRHKN